VRLAAHCMAYKTLQDTTVVKELARESLCAIFGQQDVLKAILEQDGGDAQRK